MDRHPKVEDIEFHLRKIAVLIRHHTREMLTQYGLTLPQYYALIHLRNNCMTMGELCSHLYLASSTVTDLVDRMENAGLVKRARSEEDRRIIRLELLPPGEEVVKRVMDDRMEFLSKKLVMLEDSQVTSLLDSLTNLYGLMKAE